MRAGSAAPPGPAQVTGSPSWYPHSRCFQTRPTSQFRADNKLTKPSQSSVPPPHCSPQSSPPPPCLARLEGALNSHGHPHPTQYPVSVCRVKRKASKSLARGRRLRIQAKNTGLNLTSSARTRGPEWPARQRLVPDLLAWRPLGRLSAKGQGPPWLLGRGLAQEIGVQVPR